VDRTTRAREGVRIAPDGEKAVRTPYLRHATVDGDEGVLTRCGISLVDRVADACGLGRVDA
jgi:hypothetical protein